MSLEEDFAKELAELNLVQDLPVIVGNKRNLGDVADNAWESLVASNDPPWLYQTGSVLTQVVVVDDDKTGPSARLDVLSKDRVRYHLARKAEWRVVKRTNKGDVLEPAFPPPEVVADLMAHPEPPVPALDRVVTCPTFGPNGQLQLEPGYHPASRLVYAPLPGFELPPIPEHPTPEDVVWARKLLLDELLGDFPFYGPPYDDKDSRGQAERAHALCLLLLPFLRDLIPGPTPLHLIEAPSAGTGKGLLAEVLMVPALGKGAAPMAEGRDNAEWRKSLTAALLEGSPVLLIDNITHTLDASTLSSALTEPRWRDRVLGESRTVDLPVRQIWLATGNNPRLSRELIRRSLRIRL